MRTIGLLLVAFWLPSSLLAGEQGVIQPGMDFAEAKAMLKKHYCEISECNMAIVPRNKDEQLECGSIDTEILLLVGYSKTTKKVLSLSVYFIPGGRAPKLSRVYRNASKVVFEDDDIVALSLKRDTSPKE